MALGQSKGVALAGDGCDWTSTQWPPRRGATPPGAPAPRRVSCPFRSFSSDISSLLAPSTRSMSLASSASFPPSGLPLPRELLLITDELNSPADFLLYRTVFAHLKENKSARAVVVSVSGSEQTWKIMSGKMVRTALSGGFPALVERAQGVNYAQFLASQRLVFIDAMEHIEQPDDALNLSSTIPLFRYLQTKLDALQSTPDAPALVVFDDTAALEWTGVPLLELSRFTRALSALCRKVRPPASLLPTPPDAPRAIWQTGVALILRHHVATPGEPDDLLRHLLQLCTYHLDVFPLSSGRSGAVHGQVRPPAWPVLRTRSHTRRGRPR